MKEGFSEVFFDEWLSTVKNSVWYCIQDHCALWPSNKNF